MKVTKEFRESQQRSHLKGQQGKEYRMGTPDKKVHSEASEEIVSQLRIAQEQLIEMGEEQGYLTIDDVLEVLPQIEDNLELLEEICEALDAVGITVADNRASVGVTSETKDTQESETTEKPLNGQGKVGVRIAEAADADDMLGVYLSQASRVPLLTRDEEVDLAKRIERGREASQTLARRRVSRKKVEMLRNHIEDGLAAREHLILANLRLVFSVAKRYIGRGVPLMDLVQEGHIGLMRAAKKFDYRRGYKFSTYATWWIRQAISRAVADHGRTVRLPVHMGDQISKMYRLRHKLTQELGRYPTTEELSEAIQERPEKVAKMMRYAQRSLSLELPVGEEDDATLGDFIEDDEIPAPEESTEQVLLTENMHQILEELPPREVRVLKLRYGIHGERLHTLSEVGDKMGITRERVRQIEAQALRRLRKPSFRKKLVDYLHR